MRRIRASWASALMASRRRAAIHVSTRAKALGARHPSQKEARASALLRSHCAHPQSRFGRMQRPRLRGQWLKSCSMRKVRAALLNVTRCDSASVLACTKRRRRSSSILRTQHSIQCSLCATQHTISALRRSRSCGRGMCVVPEMKRVAASSVTTSSNHRPHCAHSSHCLNGCWQIHPPLMPTMLLMTMRRSLRQAVGWDNCCYRSYCSFVQFRPNLRW